MAATPDPETPATRTVHVLLALEVPASWDPMRVAGDIAAQYESSYQYVTYPPTVERATDVPELTEFLETEAESAALERAADELRGQLPDKADEFRAAQREYLLIQEIRAARRNSLPRRLVKTLAGAGAWRGFR